MHIAIIGAGFTGLSCALRLTQAGHHVTLLESSPQVGGLAVGFKDPRWDWPLETFYHHIFTSDHDIKRLAQTVGTPYFFTRPITASYYQGHPYQLDSPSSLLAFPHLTWKEKLRTAATLALLKATPLWQPLGKFTAQDFLQTLMGRSAYQKLWHPLFVAKFGKYAPQISAAWYWARIKKRSTYLGYFQGGFQALADATAKAVETSGGKILLNTTVTHISPQSSGHIQLTSSHPKYKIRNTKYDHCLVTLPTTAFTRLTPSLPSPYTQQLSRLRYIGAQVLLLQLKKPFFPHKTYWLSILDNHFPFLAAVEHTNFIDPSHYGNQHLLYLGNYLPAAHPFFKKTSHQLLNIFDPFLKKINPHYRSSLIKAHLFQTPFAQPVVTTHYSHLLPPLTTPIKNLYLANMQQVYPWDRQTNYAVDLGQKAAQLILNTNS